MGSSPYSIFIVLPGLSHWQIGPTSLAIPLIYATNVGCQFISAFVGNTVKNFLLDSTLIVAISLDNSKGSQDSLICHSFHRGS